MLLYGGGPAPETQDTRDVYARACLHLFEGPHRCRPHVLLVVLPVPCRAVLEELLVVWPPRAVRPRQARQARRRLPAEVPADHFGGPHACSNGAHCSLTHRRACVCVLWTGGSLIELGLLVRRPGPGWAESDWKNVAPLCGLVHLGVVWGPLVW